MGRFTQKCYGCGKIRSNSYFESYGATLQKRLIFGIVIQKYICGRCYHNPEEFSVIIRRFYDIGSKFRSRQE